MNKLSIALLFSGAVAINKESMYRPLPESTGQAPWHNYNPNTEVVGHPINYPVPNFGIDHDIKVTHSNLKLEEGLLKHNLSMGPAGQVWNNKGMIKPLMYDEKDPIKYPLYTRDYTRAQVSSNQSKL